MLNWDDCRQASPRDLREARAIAIQIASLTDEVAGLDHTLAGLQRLAASPERDALVERSLALRDTLLALRQERRTLDSRRAGKIDVTRLNSSIFLAKLERLRTHIQESLLRTRIIPFGSVDRAPDNAETPSSQGHAIAEARLRCLKRVGARCLYLIARLSQRTAVHARAALAADTPSSPAPHFHSRSMAARSRMLAPAGAPPSAF